MKIICFTGGTLGHIMPCVMLIKEIKNRYKNNRIIVVSTTKDKSYEILNIKEIDKIYYIESSKASFNIKDQINNIKAYNKIKEKKTHKEAAYELQCIDPEPEILPGIYRQAGSLLPFGNR